MTHRQKSRKGRDSARRVFLVNHGLASWYPKERFVSIEEACAKAGIT